jgi:hypothetical protein
MLNLVKGFIQPTLCVLRLSDVQGGPSRIDPRPSRQDRLPRGLSQRCALIVGGISLPRRDLSGAS